LLSRCQLAVGQPISRVETSQPWCSPMPQIKAERLTVLGYPTLSARPSAPVITTDAYASDQYSHHPVVVRNFLLPTIAALHAKAVLDVGCGVGGMVSELLASGVDAYGVDLADNEARWHALGRPHDRFAVVDPNAFALPFDDGAFDFLFSFGVIEHVGTANGHADRLPNYHEIRKAWVRELFRVTKPGGHLLLGGPNRRFPIDAAHGCDGNASGIERWLYNATRLSIHRVWGRHFLWSFSDLSGYLLGLSCDVTPRRIEGLIEFGRVPALVRPLARSYVRYLPRFLLGTGANPWMLALVRRTA
jgi:SAM-dependent methyltransferase